MTDCCLNLPTHWVFNPEIALCDCIHFLKRLSI